MRLLHRSLLCLCALVFALPAIAQNTTTTITLQHLVANGAAVPYAQVCATPADSNGNEINVSSSGWGLVIKGHPFCANVVNGAISGGIQVPDAAHTTAASAIRYNVKIQVTNANGIATGSPILINAIPNVSGTTFPLDNYTPTVSTSAYPVGLIYTSGVPSGCSSPSVVIDQVGAAAYFCNAGSLVPLSIASTSVHAETADSATTATTATTATNANYATTAGSAATATTATSAATAATATYATTAGSAATATTAATAATATALATAPATCSGSMLPNGIDVHGNAINCTTVTAGTTPVGNAYTVQLRGAASGTLTPGVTYDSTGLNATNFGSQRSYASNYVDPATAANDYPYQYPWTATQYSDFRTSYDDPVQALTISNTATSGASDWIGSGVGNNPNISTLGLNLTTQTPYQGGGMLNMTATQHSGDDSVMATMYDNCIGEDRPDNEGCELWRIFLSFDETPFGGTAAFLGYDALGNPTYQVAQTSGYSDASAGEQRIAYDVTKKLIPSGDVTAVNFAYTDAGGGDRFTEVTVSADHGMGTSIITTLLGGADNQQYDTGGGANACPYAVISPVTWPANTDPYADKGDVDGSGTQTQHQCIQVASDTGMAVDDVISIWGASVNWEFTKIQAIYDPTSGPGAGNHYLKVNLKRPHSVNELVVDGGGEGWGWQGANDAITTKFVWPVVASLDSTHFLLWNGSDVSIGPKLTSYNMSGTTAPDPLTITPTISGGVVTTIATNATTTENYNLGGTAASILAQPSLTFGGGGCTTNPTFTWTFAWSGNRAVYTPTLASGGTGCATGLTIIAQSYYPNPYILYPTTRSAFVDNPTLWAALNASSTPTQRAAVSTSGYIGLDPWAAIVGSTPADGDTIQLAPNMNQYVGSQINIASQPATSKTGRQGNAYDLNVAMASAHAMFDVDNTSDAALFVGQQRNNWGPAPTSATPCPIPNVPGAGTPCYSPQDLQFQAPIGEKVDGPVSFGFYESFPPLPDVPHSRPGAVLYVNCISDGSSGLNGQMPCLSGIKSQFYMLENYDATDLRVDPSTHNWYFDLQGGSLNTSSMIATNMNVQDVLSLGKDSYGQPESINFYSQYPGTLMNQIQPENPTGALSNTLAIGSVDGPDNFYQHVAHGTLDMGSTTVATSALIANLSVGVHPPVTSGYSWKAVYSGTAGTNAYNYYLTAVLPNGEETPVSPDSLTVGAAATSLSSSNTITITNCPSAAQFGYPTGTTLNLYENPNASGRYYLLGTCTGTIVDSGTVTAITNPPVYNATAPVTAGNYQVGILGNYCFLGSTTSTSCDTFINRGAANTVNIGSTATAHDGTIHTAHVNADTDIQINGTPVCTSSGCTPNITQGSTTLVAGTATVSTSAAVAVSGGHYMLTNCAAGGTLGVLSVGTVISGTSFVIDSSSATDTSTVCWWIH